MTSRIAPQKVRCGGKIARGNLPGAAPAKFESPYFLTALTEKKYILGKRFGTGGLVVCNVPILPAVVTEANVSLIEFYFSIKENSLPDTIGLSELGGVGLTVTR